jgi:ABC-2 type transport system permease protein
MRTLWLILVSSLQRMRAVLVGSAAVGVALCVLFVLFGGIAPAISTSNPISIGYLDFDHSAVSADLRRYTTEQLGMTIVEGDSHFLETELVEKRVSAIVEVPAGFSEAVVAGSDSALLTTFMDDYANRVFLEAYLEGYTDSLTALASVAQGDETRLERLLADVEEQSAEVRSVPLEVGGAQATSDRAVFKAVMGFFLIIATMFALGMANLLYDDRVNGTYRRVKASNVHTLSYVGGICIAGFIAALLMVLVFFGFLLVVGKGTTLPLGQTMILCLLFALFIVSLSLVCGLFIDNRMAIFFALVTASTIFSLLGGAFFPVEYSPGFLQQLAHISPVFWFSEAFNGLLDGDTSNFFVSAGILALFALLGFLVAAVRFASREHSAG